MCRYVSQHQQRRHTHTMQGLAIHSLRLTMKVNQRRNKRRADAIDDSELNGSNILHCLVDPHSEWLASTTVLQVAPSSCPLRVV